MIKNIKSALFLAVAAIAISCSNPEADNSNLVIEGSIANAPQQEIYLNMFTTSGYNAIDTVQIDEEGNFKLYTNIQDWGFFQIGFDQSNAINMILLPNDKLTIQADGANLTANNTVTGSEETALYQEIIQGQLAVRTKMDSINQVKQLYSQNRDMTGFAQLLQDERALIENFQARMKMFIDNHPTSRATLVAVEQLNMDSDFEYFEKVATQLNELIPDSEYLIGLKNRVNATRSTAIGSPAPEIVLPNPEGEEISLSSLRGKYVLLDFWAAWCRPCRAENPNIVAMYNRYKDQGFTVFSVSLDGVPAQRDNAKTSWVEAIEADQLNWPYHVSDLQGWTSSAAQTYNVNSIPFSLLLDPEGNIIGKNLRGAELNSRLSTLFQ